jgi:hypothetical protein
MSKVIQRQTCVIHEATNADIPFSFNLELDFVPTKCIVRTISYRRNTGSGLHGIKCNFLKARNNIFATLVASANDDFVSNPSTTYKIDPSIGGLLTNGDVQFNIVKLGSDETPEQLDGVLGMTLEFIQEKEEPQKPIADMTTLINFLKSEREKASTILGQNQLPTMIGGCHCCQRGMVGGQEEEGEEAPMEQEAPAEEETPIDIDTRNAYNQSDPIPNIHADVDEPMEAVDIPQVVEEAQEEPEQPQE